MEPLQTPETAVLYAEHRRQMAQINAQDWMIEVPVRRPLRAALATALLAVARWIAPAQREHEFQADGFAG